MALDFYTVEEVADLLKLHVKTVRSFVREGRLKGTRLGKQYRIAREDFEAFTGAPAQTLPREDAPRTRHVEVSSIVDIDAISPEASSRVSNMLLASVKGRDTSEGPLRIDTMYDAARGRLKLILTGSTSTTASLLKLIDVLLER